MRFDGRVLPDLREAIVLRGVGLVRTDEFPDLAARWLPQNLVDTESIRVLAGHSPTDPWAINTLIGSSLDEVGLQTPDDRATRRNVDLDWVVSTWQLDHDTRAAVGTLALSGLRNLELDLDTFIGLDEEWDGGWGRPPASYENPPKRNSCPSSPTTRPPPPLGPSSTPIGGGQRT